MLYAYYRANHPFGIGSHPIERLTTLAFAGKKLPPRALESVSRSPTRVLFEIVSRICTYDSAPELSANGNYCNAYGYGCVLAR